MNRGAAAATLSILAVSLAVTAAYAPDTRAEAPQEERALPVRVSGVVFEDGFEVSERLAGRVVSRRSSLLGFERGGRVARVAVRDGDLVAADALLARLDTRELAAQRRELAARLESTRSQLELARLTVARQNQLHEAEFLAPQRLDEAISNEKTLTARLEADRAALDRVAVALELSDLRAPYAAIVAERRIDEGTVVAPGEALFSVLEDAPQRVRIGVPPEIAPRLEPGRRYEIETEVATLEAVLDAVIPELDPTTRTQTAIFDVTEGQPRVADGSLARVRFGRRVEARGSWVPLSALSEGRRGTWTAFAVVRDADGVDRVERRQVEVIHSGEHRVFVRGTLREGDQLVVDGHHRLAPGVRVRVDAEAAVARH